MDTRNHIITFFLAMLPIAAISQELKIQSFAIGKSAGG